MHTSVALLALTGSLVGPVPSPESSWLTSYSTAQKRGAETQKPLALVIGKGENGQKRLVKDSAWNEEIREAFAAHYVCVYLDADRPENQKLVKELEILSDVGLVLSNRKGDYQAFHHDGPMARTELVQRLNRHGRVEEPVLFSETVVKSSPVQSSQPIQRAEYSPVYQSVPSSTYRGYRGRSSQNC